MTTEVLTPAPPFTVSGTGPYTVEHPYQAAADLIVRAGDVLLTLDEDYTVDPAVALTAGGDVTLSAPAATLHAGATLTIVRDTVIEQGWEGIAGPRERGLERALDRLTQALQDQSAGVGRAVKLPVGSTFSPEFVPPGPDRTWIANPAGDALIEGPSAAEIAGAQAAASAAIAAASAATFAAAALAPAASFQTRAALAAMNFEDDAPAALRVLGYTIAGDGGDAIYVATGPGAGPGKVQSADGRWWQIAPTGDWRARMFGFGLGGDDNAALTEALTFANTHKGRVELPVGAFVINDFSFTGLSDVFLDGPGGDAQRCILAKAAAGGGAFFGLVDPLRVRLRGFTLDCRRDDLGDGGHGLRLARPTEWAVEDVVIRNHTNTGLIAVDPDALETQTFGGLVRGVVVDGGTLGANNGILFSNAIEWQMDQCAVRNLGVTASPGFALQLKARVSRSSIDNCVASHARAGIAMGSSEPISPSVVDSYASDNAIFECMRASRMTFCSGCHVTATRIYGTTGDGLDLEQQAHAVYIADSTNCTQKVFVRDWDEPDPVIRFRNATSCGVVVEHIRNVPMNPNLVSYQLDSVGNAVRINQYSGAVPDFTGSFVDSPAGNVNTTYWLDRAHIRRVTAIAGASYFIDDFGLDQLWLDLSSASNLDVLSGGRNGQEITLMVAGGGAAVTVRHNIGGAIRLKGGANRTLSATGDVMRLMRRASNVWVET